MKNKLISKFAAGAAMATLIIGVLGAPLSQAAVTDSGVTCSTVTVNSGVTAQTAGYTATNPLNATAALNAANYSGGSFSPAIPVASPPSAWLDPSANASTTGSLWISSSATPEGSSTDDQWRLIEHSFTLPAGAVSATGTVYFAADNATNAYLNGGTSPIGTTNTSGDDVFGTSTSGTANYNQIFTGNFTPVAGTNTLAFVVRNWGGAFTENPTGLLYKAVVNYCVPNPASTVKVTIVKYINGQPATATNASSTSFTMNAAWNATNIGSGSGQFNLSPTGFNSPTPYNAVTADMTTGASYSLNELVGTGTSTTVASCPPTSTSTSSSTAPQFALAGYTVGDSLGGAASSTPTSTSPNLTNITSDKTIIVWNTLCSENSTSTPSSTPLHVDSVTVVKGDGSADNTYANGWAYIFHLTVPNNEQNLDMRFSDWLNNATSSSSSIPVAGNMRFSSAQADSSSTITIDAANTYPSTSLHLTGDTSSSTPGRQVDVLVEVKIPVGTSNGSYTTNYGVRSLP